MLPFLDLLILAIATWRISYLAVRESAPFNLMGRFRSRTKLGGMLDCLYCTSLTSAVIMLILWHIPYLNLIVYIFAISGLCLMLASYSGANHPPQSE